MAGHIYHSQSDKLIEMKQTLQTVLDSYKEDPEKIAEMLVFKSQFWNYSLRNSILIQLQNPYSTYVASIHDWNEKGYRINKGQHGIKILFPIRTELIPVGEKDGKTKYRRVADATPEEKQKIASGELKPVTYTRFGVGTVFDISQTDCPPKDYPKIFDMGYSSEQHAELYQDIKQYAENKGIPVKEEDLKSISLRGAFYPNENVIRISDKLNDTEKLSTLTHELGHALMHNGKEAFCLPEPVREFEADCISIMLQNYVGIQLTDSRKRHFVENFNACKNIKDFKIENILKDVNLAYSNLHKELEPIFDKLVPEKAQEQRLEPKEQKTSDEEEQKNEWKKILMTKLESYPLPDTFNRMQQAALRNAVKRYVLDGAKSGNQFIEKYFSDKASEGFPVSQETRDSMIQIYRQMVRNFSENEAIKVGKSTRKIEKSVDVQTNRNTSEKVEFPYYHFYYENRYLFTVTGKDDAQRVYDQLTREAVHSGYSWTDGGKVYRSDQKEAPTSDLATADKTKTTYLPFTEAKLDQHVKYLGKIFAQEQEPRQQRKKAPRNYKDQDAVLDYVKHDVSLLTVAQAMGFTPIQVGRYYSLKEHDSVKIYPETNSFYRFSDGKGGSPIDFVMEFDGCSSKEAIQKIEEQYISGNINAIGTEKPEHKPVPVPEKIEFVLPEKVGEKYTRAFAYLTKTRCIDAAIVKMCMTHGLIYEDTKHNVVFVGKEKNGKVAFATRHTTLTKSDYKRDVAGSRQDIGWMVENAKAEKLFVCEAPIDALSIMTLMRQQGKQIDKASYLATCGTGKDTALYTRLHDNPNINVVVLANDSDDAGKKANEKIFKHLKSDFPYIKVKLLSPNNGKDINECLCKKSPKEKQKEQEVER